jgi:hypothetical protein
MSKTGERFNNIGDLKSRTTVISRFHRISQDGEKN